jgi:transcriptional regulator with XRE-family HTH domain
LTGIQAARAAAGRQLAPTALRRRGFFLTRGLGFCFCGSHRAVRFAFYGLGVKGGRIDSLRSLGLQGAPNQRIRRSALNVQISPVGTYLREWRHRRRLSQLDFALQAEISQRHLSFMESGRATPSREMLLKLAEHLDVPLRERNTWLLAAGYAPVFEERQLDSPALHEARQAIDVLLKSTEPFPALVVDRGWNLVAANAALKPLMALATDSALLQPPVNVMRLGLHPGGLAPRIVNLPEWRRHLLDRLYRQVTVTNDRTLLPLLEELRAYPVAESQSPPGITAQEKVFVPLQLRTDQGLLSFFSTATVFGTPVDITLSELTLESFFPANPETANALRAAVA